MCSYFHLGLFKLFENAIPFKPLFGEHAYTLAAVKMLLLGDFRMVHSDITIDGKAINTPGHSDVRSMVINCLHHNKYLDRNHNFPGVPTDGLFMFNAISDHQQTMTDFKGFGKIDERIKQGVAENYSGNYIWYRCKKAIVSCKDPNPAEKNITVDGEPC